MTDLVAAGSAALGSSLSDPVRLVSNEWPVVLRCRSAGGFGGSSPRGGTAVGGSVVLKAYPHASQGPASFAAEAAGLEFTTGTGVAPDLLATDPAERLVVMADLGDQPSLADLLLGTSPGRARDGLLSWARACGELAVRTVGRQREFTALLSKHGAMPAASHYLRAASAASR